MEDTKISQNILPSNYVTLAQLQQRWKKHQQDGSNDDHQKQQEEQHNNHPSNSVTLPQQWKLNKQPQQYDQDKKHKQKQQQDKEEEQQIDCQDNRGNYFRKNRNFTGSSSGASPSQKQIQNENDAVPVASAVEGNNAACVPAFVAVEGNEKEIKKKKKQKKIKRKKEVKDGETAIAQGEEAEKAPVPNRRLNHRNFTGSSSGASPSVKQNQNENDAVQVASGNDAAAFVAVEGNESEIKKKEKWIIKKEKELIKNGEAASTQGEKAPVCEEHAPLIKSQKDNIIRPMRYERKRNTGILNCIYRAKNAVETVREESVEIVDMKIGELSVEEENHERSENQNGVVATDDNGSNYSNSNMSVYRGFNRRVNNRRNSEHGCYNGTNSKYGGHKPRNFGYRARDYEYDCGIRGRNWRFAQRNGSIGKVWAKKGEAAADGEATGEQKLSQGL